MEMKKYKLGEIADIQTGPFGSQLHNEDYVSEGTPIVTVEHLGNKFFTTQNLPLVSDNDKKRLKKYILKENDIVFSRVGSVDRCSFVSIKEAGWLFSGRCLRVRPNEHLVNPQWLYYFFTQNNFKEYVRNKAVGCTMPSLNTELLSNLSITHPELDYQQKIAAVLSSLDDKIALNNRINAKLEQMAKRLYDYWFVQFDFSNENGKPYKSDGGKMVWNEELKREIPEGWEVVKFKDVITHINTGLNPRDNFSLGNGNIKYITVKNLTEKGEIDFSNCDLIDEDARELVHNRSEIEKGDILFASICPLGRCYLITSEPENWDINESVFSIRPNYSNFTSVFLYAVLRDPYYVKKMTQKATGSIFKGIRIDDIEKIELVLPEKNIIDLYTEKVESIINKQALLQEENMKLTAMRDKLLPLLMNGQVVVK